MALRLQRRVFLRPQVEDLTAKMLLQNVSVLNFSLRIVTPPSLPHRHDKTWDDLRACPEQIWCQPFSPADPRVPLSQSQPCLPQRVRNWQSGWNPELGCRGVWVLTPASHLRLYVQGLYRRGNGAGGVCVWSPLRSFLAPRFCFSLLPEILQGQGHVFALRFPPLPLV